MAWFDSFAKDYDQWYESNLGRFVDRVEKKLIEEMAKPEKNEQVLDMGAGTGTYSLWLAKKGLQVTAVDQSKEMLKIAQDKAEKEGLNIEWQIGDAHQLPFKDGTFDLVVSVTAVEFMDHPKKALREAMRVLKPNGRLVIGVLTKESSWGELYTQKAEEDPNNLFAKAHLYREEEIETLLPYSFQLKKGLYLPPVMQFDEKEAEKIERERQGKQEKGAGFFVIRWDKENSK
ncbi:class I SAM-dependent methyltransferase [Tepidibacillus fermentans]|uniref:Methyltransferase family protein n=1 Tax=Tepidibacillus fermentans TaxID=1281767 RepID=A0A4V2URY9_9BACI|nr:class I SAM-dependent methyltransferase [Tepidibacillus fermentans]TCS79412.1 methyltransferase family protein [Tepidibacillus fermentans]